MALAMRSLPVPLSALNQNGGGFTRRNFATKFINSVIFEETLTTLS